MVKHLIPSSGTQLKLSAGRGGKKKNNSSPLGGEGQEKE